MPHKAFAGASKNWLTAWALIALSLSACADQPSSGSGSENELQTIAVAELSAALGERACTALDANTPAVRARNGAIPGATLLTHYRDYALTELPADKRQTLVFYCANERCTASDVAARRAADAGYSDVRVLRSGIAGWSHAGRSTQPVASVSQ